jgi:hypothetical protein
MDTPITTADALLKIARLEIADLREREKVGAEAYRKLKAELTATEAELAMRKARIVTLHEQHELVVNQLVREQEELREAANLARVIPPLTPDQVFDRQAKIGRLYLRLRWSRTKGDRLWKTRTAERSEFGPFTHVHFVSFLRVIAGHGAPMFALFVGPLAIKWAIIPRPQKGATS